uniref:Uncharacterized protein n=1 Tax=Callorhinchus milii TaxID=7868 RepID=A0A4W3J6D6_CALMI
QGRLKLGNKETCPRFHPTGNQTQVSCETSALTSELQDYRIYTGNRQVNWIQQLAGVSQRWRESPSCVLLYSETLKVSQYYSRREFLLACWTIIPWMTVFGTNWLPSSPTKYTLHFTVFFVERIETF